MPLMALIEFTSAVYWYCAAAPEWWCVEAVGASSGAVLSAGGGGEVVVLMVPVPKPGRPPVWSQQHRCHLCRDEATLVLLIDQSDGYCRIPATAICQGLENAGLQHYARYVWAMNRAVSDVADIVSGIL